MGKITDKHIRSAVIGFWRMGVNHTDMPATLGLNSLEIKEVIDLYQEGLLPKDELENIDNEEIFDINKAYKKYFK